MQLPARLPTLALFLCHIQLNPLSLELPTIFQREQDLRHSKGIEDIPPQAYYVLSNSYTSHYDRSGYFCAVVDAL